MGIEGFNGVPEEPVSLQEVAEVEKNPDVPNSEILLLKEDLIARLHTEGFSEEIRAEIVKWRQFRETLVQNVRDSIILNIDMFDMYVAAGMPEDAFEDAQETYLQAMQEEQYDLVDRILKIYPELEGGLSII